MHRHASVLLLLLVACSSEAPKNPIDDLRTAARDAGPSADPSPATTSTTSPASSTPAPRDDDPTTTTLDAGVSSSSEDAGSDASLLTTVCDLGDGLYCGGNHVNGKPNELYRCTAGVPVLETVCEVDCARMPDGIDDRCSCALGDGLYCGGNGVNGDTGALFRCTGGVAAVESVCANGCETQPDGINDNCL